MPDVETGGERSASRRWPGALVIAAVFLALHLPFLPASLEDLDSINFALGLRDFDVARHQPHPPGYPLYIATGKAVRALVGDETNALSVVGVVAGGLGVVALAALFAQIGGLRRQWPIAAAALAASSPLYWVTAARPLSDVPGLAASIAVQALVLSATTASGAIVASFFAALAIGIRSQAAWLTLPLLVFVIGVRFAWRGRVAAAAIAAFVAGCAVWAVPLVVLTGGPAAYWHAVFDQGAEDLTGIQMLWTTPTVRQLVSALYYALVAAWASWQVAAGILAAAAAGAVLSMWRSRDRDALTILAVAFAPYFLFDLLFQETFTTRYALPLVVPIAYLATRAVAAAPRSVGLTLAAGAVALNMMLAAVSVRQYASMPAPVFRMLTDMRTAAAAQAASQPTPVLAMHRRQNLDTRRPLQWAAAGVPAFPRRLPAPPKHEWLEVVKYWNSGGTDPVWFVADPMRTDLALIDRPGRRERTYAWPLQYPRLIGGVRPGDLQWYVFDAPGWYLGEGWALTPETAGVADEDHRGPGIMPIEGWIRRRPEALTLMIGGRNLRADGTPVHAGVMIDGRPIDDLVVPPGAFLRFVTLPERALDGAGRSARLSIAADSARLAIEQFDAQSAGQLMFGFGDGWYEHEYNPVTARMWRWMSERGAIRVRGRRALRLVLTGETDPLPRPSRVTVRVADRVVAEFTVGREFSVQTVIPADLLRSDENEIVVETDQVIVPAERSRRSQDRRHLGLRVFDLQLRPAS